MGAAAMPKIKAPKAATAAECSALEQLPNVGPAMAADLRLLGIAAPQALQGRDGLQLYLELCRRTGQRHDPCVLDTLLAVVDFMHGAAPAPWWAYTAERKRRFGQVPAELAGLLTPADGAERAERAERATQQLSPRT